MKNEAAYKILLPLIWKIAKSDGEPLWVHQFTTFLIFKKFLSVGSVPYCNDKKLNLLALSILLHDLKKMTDWNQMILKGETDNEKIIKSYQDFWCKKGVSLSKEEISFKKRLFKSGRTDHQIQNENDKIYILKDYLEKIQHLLDFTITDNEINIISDIIKHHFITDDNISSATLSGFGNYIKILQYCDRLASLKIIDYDLIDEIRALNIGRQLFDLTYFTFSRKLLPSAAILFNTAIKEYKKKGWDVLCLLENGIIFICKDEKEIPTKKHIINLCVEKFIEDNLSIINVEFGRKSNFTGLTKAYPQKFIKIKKDILKGLLTQDKIPERFFKLVGELYSLFEKDIKKIREEYFIIDILLSLVSGTRGIPEAGKKWKEIKNEDLPSKEDGKVDKIKSLQYIFDNSYISNIVQQNWMNEKNITNKKLNELLQDELLEILLIISENIIPTSKYKIELEEIYNSLFLAEENNDFKKIAMKYFNNYKKYKSNPTNPNVGICEICGMYITQKPGADFLGGITRFSQIKALPIDRKTCPLCAYDNTKNVQRIQGNRFPVILNLLTRVPINPVQISLLKFIASVKDGLTKLNELIIKNSLIPDLEMPYEETDEELEIIIDINNKSSLSLNIENIPANKFSKKDLIAKYEPLYHLLNLLGYKVSIGIDERTGLFGEQVLSSKEKYYKSLAIIILQRIIKRTGKKRSKVFMYSKELLDKSPSSAITLIDQLNYSKQNANLYKSFIQCLIIANKEFKKLGGEFSMKDLLEDAKFFAENVPIFYWEDYKNVTKHKISKPIADFMNEVLFNRNYQEAIAKFLSTLRKNISAEKKEQLKPFIENAKKKLKKYYELKNESITDFIRAKNALISAIFTFRRYEILSEVNFDE